MDQYKDFGVEDFVWDRFFRQWVLAPTRESDYTWNQWLTENPEFTLLTNEARQMVLAYRVDEPEISGQEIEKIVKRTISRIYQPETDSTQKRTTQPFFRTMWFQLAASVALLMMVTWWVKVYNPVKNGETGQILNSEKTGSVKGQIEKINTSSGPLLVKLEDGSRITLRPGSLIRYAEHFSDMNREVLLIGEAFFEISKDHDRPFLVYANELVTKVLGTSFTIRALESSREVTVEVKTGRVSVFAKSDPKLHTKISKRELEGVILSPNQKIIFERDEVRMVKTLVEKPEIIVPKAQIPHFEFEDTPASEAFATIGKAYGIDILFDEELLQDCPLTAGLDNQTLHEKLSIICKAVEANYEILDGQIIIHSKGCRN
jgi:transmembrane sensor